jgi:hypothetical protein
MPSKAELGRAIGAIALPLVCLVVAALVDEDPLSTFFLAAAVIAFTVMLFEAALERAKALRPNMPPSDASDLEPRGRRPVAPRLNEPDPSHDLTTPLDPHTLTTARLIEVFSFVGTSTPTLVGVARVDGFTVLTGWLDLLCVRLSRAVDGAPTGAMVVRESLVLGEADFIPVCEVAAVGGSRRCTLPVGSAIELLTGDLSVDVAQAVGARKIYMASFDTSADRCWACLTFTTSVSHELLRPLCDLIVAPIAQTLSEAERHALPRVAEVTTEGKSDEDASSQSHAEKASGQDLDGPD